jgi:hypothetical protein
VEVANFSIKFFSYHKAFGGLSLIRHNKGIRTWNIFSVGYSSIFGCCCYVREPFLVGTLKGSTFSNLFWIQSKLMFVLRMLKKLSSLPVYVLIVPCHSTEGKAWLLPMEPQVEPQVTSSEICGGCGDTGAVFTLSFFGFPLLIITPPLLHTHLSPSPKVCNIPD